MTTKQVNKFDAPQGYIAVPYTHGCVGCMYHLYNDVYCPELACTATLRDDSCDVIFILPSSRRNFPAYATFVRYAYWASIDEYCGNDMFGYLDTDNHPFAKMPFVHGNLVTAGCLDAGMIDWRADWEC